jgi:hypothetical protein
LWEGEERRFPRRELSALRSVLALLLIGLVASATAGAVTDGTGSSPTTRVKSCKVVKKKIHGVTKGVRVCTKRPARPKLPNYVSPGLSVLKRSTLDAHGYVFVAPKDGVGAQGPEIVDDHGRPVWFHPTSDDTGDFRVQRYRGEPVLTWWQGAGFAESGGVDYVLDSSYRVIATVRAGSGLAADGHEFVLTPQGTALITVYHEVPYDLSPVGGPKDGKVVDGVVQEIDVATGRVIFEWHSIDHVPLDESYEPVSSAYDYFHINAVNLDDDGNMLISGRHTWTVYKVDRSTGQVLWRLGGKRSDFELGPGARFAWQHNPLPAGENTIRLFDNESNGSNQVATQSRVIWIHLDTAARTASLVREIAHPDSLSVQSQGNAQALDNADTFVGWGQSRRVSEFDPQGKLLFDAVLPGGNDTYRAYRADWTGRPPTRPTAIAWTNANGTTTVHALWNGATEVTAWRVLGGRSAKALNRVRTVRWNGLDTTIRIRGTPHEVEVVAIDARGTAIGTSRPVRDA